MTTITLEVPEDLASRLIAERDRLPEALDKALQLLPPRPAKPAPITPSAVLAFVEMVQFLASRPTPEQIAAFKISSPAQARLVDLLEKNREQGLTEIESAELDWYERVHEIMTWLKAQARPVPAN